MLDWLRKMWTRKAPPAMNWPPRRYCCAMLAASNLTMQHCRRRNRQDSAAIARGTIGRGEQMPEPIDFLAVDRADTAHSTRSTNRHDPHAMETA